ncbi:MAG: 30S ribosomal protein S6 [Bacteroidetes bacterium]|nr:30S ribosomal protein S6 [Rhodothermia bacterium]MCS7155381.1 30S ribosomal protein S6 [Bacteroidota bacterium]MCX7907526.1 30S ribosomal protein S6 [Bacteroidota bacterium]MDW8138520.1 30S ribosomal protein S6 [Bacteroidota bacterium]MDW8284543.1 30S ribosomal protein S6 [Bacteroidota bacterium]
MTARVFTYEGLFILNPMLEEKPLREEIDRIRVFLLENGAEIEEWDEWGVRRLAYPIQKKRSGFYVNFFFKAPSTLVPKLERQFLLTDNVMRFLLMKLDAKALRHREKAKAQKQAESGSTAA